MENYDDKIIWSRRLTPSIVNNDNNIIIPPVCYQQL